jgi:peroxidase
MQISSNLDDLSFVPGPTYLKTYNLITRNTLSSDYDPNINPSINNEFAAAAYRVGHTLLQGVIK